MKKLIPVVGTALPIALALTLASSGCSSSKAKSSQELSSTGPTVVQVKAEPETIALNGALKPMQPANVFADVKDFTGKVQDVRLRFVHVPIEVQMQPTAGSTWQGVIPPNALKKLAVSGQTMRYQADVIARDSNGHIATSAKPIEIAVKAPEASQLTG